MALTIPRPTSDTVSRLVDVVRRPQAELPDRTTDISNLREVLDVYLRAGSPRVILVGSAGATAARLLLGGFGTHDLIAAGAVVAMTGTVEWVIHKFLLHAPEDSWRTRKLETSTDHRRHHQDPTDLRHVLLMPAYAAAFLPAIGVFTASWTFPLVAATGWPLLPTFLSGLTASWWTLAHYEWVHLAVHTRHRFRNRFYARLARNHRLHHYRNENYWLGVTANSGDRLLGTLPASKSDVPLSETARSLA
ncbi:MAG: sterol desaturase family protein [Acidimicrobiia bacterium]|nr:sterol desaturase family protein [Acidimicrobiia bacterium]